MGAQLLRLVVAQPWAAARPPGWPQSPQSWWPAQDGDPLLMAFMPPTCMALCWQELLESQEEEECEQQEALALLATSLSCLSLGCSTQNQDHSTGPAGQLAAEDGAGDFGSPGPAGWYLQLSGEGSETKETACFNGPSAREDSR